MARRLLIALALLASIFMVPASSRATTWDTPDLHRMFSAEYGGDLYVRDEAFTGQPYWSLGVNTECLDDDGTTRLGTQWAASGVASGIVDGFGGNLTLGQLTSSGYRIGAPDPAQPVLLWLDTGADARFFAFDGTGKRTGTNGDSAGVLAPALDGSGLLIDGTTQYTPSQSPAPAGTLSDLQATYGPGIRVAIWTGQRDGHGSYVNWLGVSGATHTPCFSGTLSVPLVRKIVRGSDLPLDVTGIEIGCGGGT